MLHEEITFLTLFFLVFCLFLVWDETKQEKGIGVWAELKSNSTNWIGQLYCKMGATPNFIQVFSVKCTATAQSIIRYRSIMQSTIFVSCSLWLESLKSLCVLWIKMKNLSKLFAFSRRSKIWKKLKFIPALRWV